MDLPNTKGIFAESTLRILSAFSTFDALLKRFRSFNTKNFGSVDQRAAKLLAVKVGVLKKKSAASAIPSEMCASAFGPGSSPGSGQIIFKV